MTGLREVLWLVELRDDVESDLSVFHRIEEMETMASSRFLRLAPRLGAYAGAVAARMRLRASAAQQALAEVQQPEPRLPSRPVAFRQGPPSSAWSRATSGGTA